MKKFNNTSLLACLLLCLVACGEGENSSSPEVPHEKSQNNLPTQGISMEKPDSPTSCIHDYHPEPKGKIVIGPHDSLATLVANSSIVGENLEAKFGVNSATYSAIGENVDVVFNTGFGVITLPKNLVVEFSHTDSMYVEERRDRSLAERFVDGATFRALPLYYRMDCLNPDIDALQKQITSLGFEPVVLKMQKTLPEIEKLFASTEEDNRLRQYYFAAWRRGDVGIVLSIVQAEMRADLINEPRANKFLYNLVFNFTYIPESWYWTEVQ